jgi:hydroxymethylglutaryl-CoA reductase
MALHARNIALVAGARGEEVDWLARRLVEAGDVRADRAVELLRERRGA